jgi:hypothetical protein
MKKTMHACLWIICAVALMIASCAKETVKNNGNSGDEIPFSELDIEQKFLAEGFISDDLYRVVIVTPRESVNVDTASIKTRAVNRARVSLERSLVADNIPCDRNTKAAILLLIDRSGQLISKDIEHKRYVVYYFDITRKNMKNYFKNLAAK